MKYFDLNKPKEEIDAVLHKLWNRQIKIDKDTFLELLKKNFFYPPHLINTKEPLVFDTYNCNHKDVVNPNYDSNTG